MTRIELIVTIGVICVLLVLLIPQTTKITCSCAQNKDLSKAKQIYLGLKMYAGDNNGHFPRTKADSTSLANSNEAYRNLIPDYVPTEEVFYIPKSPWTPKPFDFKKLPKYPLAAGRNHWAYVPNLTDTDNPKFPIIASGFGKQTPGVYTPNTRAVVVITVDGSGKVEPVTSTDYRVYTDVGGTEKRDIFKPAPGWLRPDQAPLNPEG